METGSQNIILHNPILVTRNMTLIIGSNSLVFRASLMLVPYGVAYQVLALEQVQSAVP